MNLCGLCGLCEIYIFLVAALPRFGYMLTIRIQRIGGDDA
jgi:hypothetical protein